MKYLQNYTLILDYTSARAVQLIWLEASIDKHKELQRKYKNIGWF